MLRGRLIGVDILEFLDLCLINSSLISSPLLLHVHPHVFCSRKNVFSLVALLQCVLIDADLREFLDLCLINSSLISSPLLLCLHVNPQIFF